MKDYLLGVLRQMKALGATDLFLTCGKAPAFRIHGKITNTDGEALNGDRMRKLAREILSEQQYTQFQHDMESNLCYSISPTSGRFRISLFQQRGNIAIVVRAIPDQVPDMETLGIPPVMKKMVMAKRGLIVLVGPAGTGKSTTLASLLDYRSANDVAHIITLEDPIEYLLSHKRSIVNQREIGFDAKSYHIALENALRQSPDVIAIGEIRNRDAMEQALMFADTGHLCLTTLHASNATQAFDRIINMFPEAKREQIRLSLSLHTKAIVSQQLIPGVDGKLVAAFEVLTSTPHVADLIHRGDFGGLTELMEKSGNSGMQTMDQSLFSLYKQNRISPQTALEYASSYQNMRLRIRLKGVAANTAT